MKKKIFLLILSVTLLCGCSRQPTVKPKVITKITISGPNLSEREYTSPKKLQKFLSYFRSFADRPTGNREAASGTGAYHIVLHYQDGSRITWTQTEDNYLKQGGQLWQQIRPGQERRLRLLLAAVPEDKN